jgi:hypothetical protein
LSSCKKTIGLEPLAQNEILEYKITNLTDTIIYGAIDQSDHTITVYVPYYYSLSLIDPEIKVSTGAKIEGEVLPVLISAKNTTYSVIAADGTKNTYTLNIVQQNTPSLSLEWTVTGLVTKTPIAYPADVIANIRGNFLSTNGVLVDLSLTNIKTNKVTTFTKDNGFLEVNDNLYNYFGKILPADIDTGYYKTRVQFLGHDVTLEYPLHIIHRQPDLLMPSREVKQGGTITFAPFNSVFVGLKAARVTVGGKTYNLTIESFTPSLMTLKFPDDFPIGKYYYSAGYSFDFEGWQTVNKTGDLTVLAK